MSERFLEGLKEAVRSLCRLLYGGPTRPTAKQVYPDLDDWKPEVLHAEYFSGAPLVSFEVAPLIVRLTGRSRAALDREYMIIKAPKLKAGYHGRSDNPRAWRTQLHDQWFIDPQTTDSVAAPRFLYTRNEGGKTPLTPGGKKFKNGEVGSGTAFKYVYSCKETFTPAETSSAPPLPDHLRSASGN